MHSHDPDLVAALADGSLGREQAAAAEADVAACARCSADLEAQRTALNAIATAEVPRLSATEIASLRAAVAAAVDIEPLARPAATAPRRISWPAIGLAAAALAGIVAVVPVLGLLSTSGEDTADTALPFAAEMEEATGDPDARSNPAAELEAQDAGGDSLGAAAEESSDDGEEGVMAATPETPPSTVPAGTSTTAAAATTEAAADTTAVLDPIEGTAGLGRILADGDVDAYVAVGEADDGTCREAAAAELGADPARLSVPLVLSDGTELLVFVDADRARAAGFDAGDCSLQVTAP